MKPQGVAPTPAIVLRSGVPKRSIVRTELVDRRGRTWTLSLVPTDQAEEEDFRFWYEELTPEERVRAVEDCLKSSLQAKGLRGTPRLRRVSRRARCPWR